MRAELPSRRGLDARTRTLRRSGSAHSADTGHLRRGRVRRGGDRTRAGGAPGAAGRPVHQPQVVEGLERLDAADAADALRQGREQVVAVAADELAHEVEAPGHADEVAELWHPGERGRDLVEVG